ncbi:LysR family transcriptional regulator [Nocardia tenerifensis]|uniref:LysR family transcriptional regulator n=1 Tax=Nocardia tenerifensis TaxID=228006 RepID=A0A318JSY4_9NOCA|nr:LysR substrate-binding domain-containing protein [Nocardia tenerifensis]PXX59639.1 LysR family transcriptional regulator [Nocardia tenerifensis]
MDLTQRLLEQYVAVAEEQHFGRAARRLSMSQPPLSQAIARLERGLGVTLLERGTRSVRLTPAGAAFARDATRLLAAQQAAIDRARRIGHGLSGELRVGTVTLLDYRYVPAVLRAAAEDLPGIHLRLHQDPSAATLVDMVRADALDLAFARSPVTEADDLTVEIVATDRLVAALPRTHRWAGRASIELAELRSENFVLPSAAAPELAQQVQLACREAGFTPRDYASADATVGLLTYVAAGLCVSLVPEMPFPEVKFVPLHNPSTFAEIPLVSVHRNDADISVRRLIEVVRTVRPPEAGRREDS